MKVRVKKQNKDGIVRLESSGKIKEFIFKEDFLHKEDSSLLVCFKGKDSSGIIELSSDEIERLYYETIERKKLLSESAIMKFAK